MRKEKLQLDDDVVDKKSIPKAAWIAAALFGALLIGFMFGLNYKDTKDNFVGPKSCANLTQVQAEELNKYNSSMISVLKGEEPKESTDLTKLAEARKACLGELPSVVTTPTTTVTTVIPPTTVVK